MNVELDGIDRGEVDSDSRAKESSGFLAKMCACLSSKQSNKRRNAKRNNKDNTNEKYKPSAHDYSSTQDTTHHALNSRDRSHLYREDISPHRPQASRYRYTYVKHRVISTHDSEINCVEALPY